MSISEEELDIIFKKKASKWAMKQRDKSSRKEVGCAERKPYLIDDKVYLLTLEAFWEKQSYYECTVEGVGFDYFKVLTEDGQCIAF